MYLQESVIKQCRVTAFEGFIANTLKKKGDAAATILKKINDDFLDVAPADVLPQLWKKVVSLCPKADEARKTAIAKSQPKASAKADAIADKEE